MEFERKLVMKIYYATTSRGREKGVKRKQLKSFNWGDCLNLLKGTRTLCFEVSEASNVYCVYIDKQEHTSTTWFDPTKAQSKMQNAIKFYNSTISGFNNNVSIIKQGKYIILFFRFLSALHNNIRQ